MRAATARPAHGDLRLRGPGHVSHGPHVSHARDTRLDRRAALQRQRSADDLPLTVDAGDTIADTQLHGQDRLGRFSTGSRSRRHPFTHPALADVNGEIGRAHVLTPVTWPSRMP